MSSAMSEMPQDSVLRRHWQSAREMEPSASKSSRSGSTESISGFFGWLKSVFS